MGLLSTLLAPRPEARATVGPTMHPSAEPAGSFADLFGAGVSTAGARITPANALTVGALYAAIRFVASSVGQLPLQILRRSAESERTPARGHRLWSLLNDSPNELLTAIEFRELLTAWAILHGNGCAFLELNTGGSIESITPIDPEKLTFWLTPDRTALIYEYRRPNGTSVFLPRDQVLHLRGPIGNAYIGVGLLALMRDTLGLTLVAEEHASRFYSNAAAPAGVLQVPKALKPDAFKKLREQWNARHQGAGNAFKTAILEDGVEWKAISLNLKDQQFLETRTFQIQEVARWVGVPPHLIGELSRSTNNNIEAQGIEVVTYCLAPWCIRWEQRIKLDCLGPEERKTLYAKHKLDSFLRGQTLSRFQSYQIGRQGGWLSPNDVRALEDQDPIEGGDSYMAPLNMVPLPAFGEPDPNATPGDAPGTPAGGTRSYALTPEARASNALRPIALAMVPLLDGVVLRCVTRALHEQQALTKRGAVPSEADVAAHASFVHRTIAPVVHAFATGVAESAGCRRDEGSTQMLADLLARSVAQQWGEAFRANVTPDAATLTARTSQALGQHVAAWAACHLHLEQAA